MTKAKNRKMIILAIVCIIAGMYVLHMVSGAGASQGIVLEGKDYTWSCYDPLDDYDCIIRTQVVEYQGGLALEYIESETKIHTFLSDKIAEHGSKVGDDVKVYVKFY